jgi:hypothetical protein
MLPTNPVVVAACDGDSSSKNMPVRRQYAALCAVPGDVNNGSTFPWEPLKKLIDIRIGLGIEVFPNSPDPL